jgi:hypothetical protein
MIRIVLMQIKALTSGLLRSFVVDVQPGGEPPVRMGLMEKVNVVGNMSVNPLRKVIVLSVAGQCVPVVLAIMVQGLMGLVQITAHLAYLNGA